MKYFASGATDTGRVRSRNEDFFLVDEPLGLYLVCDGMGGHSAGDVASQLAAERVRDTLREYTALIRSYTEDPKHRTRRKMRGLLDKAVQNACTLVWNEATKDKGKQGMGTTLAMLLVCGPNAFVVHVGDSRVYLVRGRTLCQLTEDHTLINDMVRHGMITPEKAAVHPHKNALTRAIGIQEAVHADILHVEVMLGDRFLLCSDGLTKHLSGQEILATVVKLGADEVTAALLKRTNARGGSDNVTAVLVGADEGAAGAPQSEHNTIVAAKIDTLRRIPMFAGFEYKQLVKFLEIGEVRTVESGETVIREGEEGATMYVILFGQADVFRGGARVNSLEPGDYFGEMSLIDKVPRSATVVTSARTTFLTLERERFFALTRSDAGIATSVFWSLVQKLNSRLRRADDEVHRLKQSLEGEQA
ncbi:Stp1/IreP family PP2C-type Ser/Thr phosphatase [Haliangium ochraceum]|uniref:Cyclic nucleotide-binding protein n=1 Tax=Haliangium ochraceum (strain DSM 14365 / JCM 11303 / SMP-2) TaxID=502025 RepID=D0LV06_HALO1|nr:Stp1/IreP family PP2C-type Ser/Thr phosphatase [Haliangium ochraceum]ACY15847.1 cyclic nucleotide-binding protein [Haliangium ochraceum DSM 14365]